MTLPALLGSVMADVRRLDPQPFLDPLRTRSAPSDTTGVLGHLAAPGPLRPVIGAAGRFAAWRFHAGYQASGQALPGPARLRWHTALHALRILLEAESWRHDAALGQRQGHPWLVIGPAAANALRRTTGTAVPW